MLFLGDRSGNQIFRWLSAPDPTINHDAARKKWQPDTGLWLTRNPDYIRWRDDAGPNLWVYGIREFPFARFCPSIN
jgi:hypothetical protein